MTPKKKKKANDGKEKTASFTWTDEEIELLLDVIHHYKSGKDGWGSDWQSVNAKNDDLWDLFIEQYPSKGSATDFPHPNAAAEFTKERINSKIKIIRQKYRSALDSGRKSGGGRIVAQLYEKCSAIWGKSPKTDAYPAGIESAEQPFTESSAQCIEATANAILNTFEMI